MCATRNTLDVDGHRIAVTNLDKVLYPATGTRKAEVIDYYNRIAEVLLPHVHRRPVTRKRWPDGVDSEPFFEKNLPAGTPEWIDRVEIAHRSTGRDGNVSYPLAGERADLIWFGQQGALELHVPQWAVPADVDGPDVPRLADRIVLDLDPGPGVDLSRCAEIAVMVRDLLDGVGLRSYPVTSGSKGIHVYAGLDRPVSADGARSVAKQIAMSLAARHPETVTAVMNRAVRTGKVFIDWSQNSASKTTLAPYSLRGREQPWAAAPRSWEELARSDIRQLLFTEVLERVEVDGDLLADLDRAPVRSGRSETDDEPVTESDRPVVDLSEYRRKRDEARTPEPFGDNESAGADRERGPIFVIQEHHARRLHYDFRLERDGVLVSWAVPKNLPADSGQNRLAVQTEDHPMDYADFAGDIPAGEYGGGHVEIWDRGTYETEKWRPDEVIVRLRGDRIQGRYALIRTGDKNWLAHLMSDEPRPITPDSLRDPRPMLATEESIENLSDEAWAFEGKWDGYRLIVEYLDGKLRLITRSGIDMTTEFPELGGIVDDLGLLDVVLDGEVVALDSSGHTNFSLLAARNATGEQCTIKLMLFDVLFLNGRSLLRTPWSGRRQVLDELAPLFTGDNAVQVPPLLPGPGGRAAEVSREKGYEGAVAKRRDSVYQQGRRSASWLKHKNWRDIEVIVGGWRPGKGNRTNGIGSLLVGLPESTGLRYVGRVGTGFTERQLRALADELEPLRRRSSPFVDKLDRPIEQDAVWVLPKLVGDVRYMDWTGSGHLRHPVWRGIRRDKLPGDL
ncbi:ATP-dependent DNA ligase [Williamsia sterculiae]|uniref:DNA ligase (ATP) n=1 Tax=Williamsia sterculiae TaxID=1344003 RepID=A0A1N7HCM3_9NOCA|nr:ATP-dependent DNA ligase [Williamsia sterculiae]SIS22562.1 ATP-dependent DNA ligase LigD ligase module /ATP-dependent DNA ligase LigD phosphoesterase module /ATP-dependent DNA ligase LigD polymerase module [Williamsia sterculiae]